MLLEPPGLTHRIQPNLLRADQDSLTNLELVVSCVVFQICRFTVIGGGLIGLCLVIVAKPACCVDSYWKDHFLDSSHVSMSLMRQAVTASLNLMGLGNLPSRTQRHTVATETPSRFATCIARTKTGLLFEIDVICYSIFMHE